MADVKYIITADTKGAVKGIDKVGTSIKGMKTQATKSVSPLKGMFTQLAAGLIATIGIGIAFKKLAGFMKDSIEAAGIQELAEKGLTDALQSTGREVPINAAHFKAYASELQQATLYGDEAILGAQALMIQLTDLDKEGLDRATAGALGMATVFKTDLKSATNLIAKALAGNYGALSRYGISVSDLNTEEEKRASLLDQLTILYERAKGEVDTYEGTVTQLKNTYGDFQEKIGDVIVESEILRSDISLIQLTMSNFIASGTMDAWADKFDFILQNVPAFAALRTSLQLLNIDMEGQILQQKYATETGEKWLEFLEDSDEALNILGVDLYEAMREFAGLNKEVKIGKNKFAELVPEIKKTNKELKKIEEIIDETVLPAYREWSGLAYNTQEEIKTHVFNANDAIVTDTDTTMGEINEYWDQLATDVGLTFGGLVDSLLDETTTFEDGWDGFISNLKASFRGMIADMIADWVTGLMTEMVSKTKTAASGISSSMATIGQGISGIGAGLGALITTLATAIATAAGIIAAAAPEILIAAGVALAIYAGFKLISSLFAKKGMGSSAEWHLKQIWINTNALPPMEGAINDINGHTLRIAVQTQGVPPKLDKMNQHLKAIRNSLAGPSVSAQGGFYSPSLPADTTIRAHKGEGALITPRGRGSSALWNATKYGQQKIHERSIVKR